MNARAGRSTPVFSWAARSDGVAIVELEVPGSPENLLRPGDADDLARVADELAAAPGLVAVVLASAVPRCFCAGVDLDALDAFSSPHDGSDAARAAQQALERLESLGLPTVAAIDGPCLGPGLELALVASHRVATDTGRTRLGHPAVELGLIPAAGGTQRLPAAIAPDLALELLCSGRSLSAREALDCGLVHELVVAGSEREVAVAQALALAARGARRRWLRSWVPGIGRPRPGSGRRWSAEFRRVRQRWEVAGAARRRAVACIIDAVVEGIDRGARAGQEVERRAFGELVVSHDSRHRRALRREAIALASALPRAGDGVAATPLEAVGIFGAPTALALVEACALAAGLTTLVLDRDPLALERVRADLRASLEGRAREGGPSPAQRARALARIRAPADEADRAALSIAVDGDAAPAAPRAAAALEALVGARTVIATPAFATTVAAVTASAREPSRWVGLRYLPPGEAGQLAEITPGPQTAPAALAVAAELAQRQGCTPVVVRDVAGGFGLRLLVAYVGEGLHLLADGAAVADVDAALVEWGFARGPLALLDDVGWRPLSLAAAHLARAVDDQLAFPAAAARLLASGRGGRATRAGCYRYAARGRRRGPDPAVRALLDVAPRPIPPRAVVDRCVLRITAATIACLDAAVLEAGAASVGAVLAVGFPPGRGGPLRHADALGARALLVRYHELARALGSRFEPPRLLQQLARSDVAAGALATWRGG